jgi:hypothetical protein
MSVRRKRLIPLAKPINNRSPKDWNLGYELVVSFEYGLDEEAISKVAGLRNYDTGITLATNLRDLMFPCGTDKVLAYSAANRLKAADHFGALRIRISYPVEHVGKDDFTLWYSPDGKLLEKVKHRKLHVISDKKVGNKRTIKYGRRGRRGVAA